MSCYVRRTRGSQIGWTGPIRSEKQAHREAAAWTSERFSGGPWAATVEPSTDAVKAEVRAWERSKR